MLGDELGHFKHTDRLFAFKYFLEIFIGIDIALVLGVLKTILFDVYPEFFNNLRSRHRPLANYKSQFGTDIHWLHKSTIGVRHVVMICYGFY